MKDDGECGGKDSDEGGGVDSDVGVMKVVNGWF